MEDKTDSRNNEVLALTWPQSISKRRTPYAQKSTDLSYGRYLHRVRKKKKEEQGDTEYSLVRPSKKEGGNNGQKDIGFGKARTA